MDEEAHNLVEEYRRELNKSMEKVLGDLGCAMDATFGHIRTRETNCGEATSLLPLKPQKKKEKPGRASVSSAGCLRDGAHTNHGNSFFNPRARQLGRGLRTRWHVLPGA